MEIKISIIGAGSTYTPELIEGLINRKEHFKIRELALMDIDVEKLTIVGGLAQRMLSKAGLETSCKLTQSLDEALENSDYVIAQIRVGKLAARLIDEKTPLKYGFIGQETTGMGGFFKGLRTIPVIMDIVKKMELLCPNAWLINFSNPSGLIAEAVLNNSDINMVGLCNIAVNMYSKAYKYFETKDLDIEYLGLNHLTWMTSIRKDGIDYLANELDDYSRTLKSDFFDSQFDIHCLRMAQGIPCSYLRYYYNRKSKLEELIRSEKLRAEECMEIEKELLDLYQNKKLGSKPVQLGKRGGTLYSEAAISFLDSLINSQSKVHVLNLKNKGALKFMDYDDVVEIPAMVSSGKVEPIPKKAFSNIHVIDMMRIIKLYEKHAVKAALAGDKAEALKAMAIHPLIGDISTANKCFEEMLMLHKSYLPLFK